MHLLHQDLTSLIIKTFYEVYNELGYGFSKKFIRTPYSSN